jgi:hypothetical protein
LFFIIPKPPRSFSRLAAPTSTLALKIPKQISFWGARRKFYRRHKSQTKYSNGVFDRRKKILNFSPAIFGGETLDGKRGNYRDKAFLPTPRGAASNTILTQ